MKKWKATVLLTITVAILAVLTAMAFLRFPIGVKDFNGFLGAISTDYDVSGGTAYTLTLEKDNLKDVENIDEVIATLKYRLDLLGYENYSVKALKDDDEHVYDYDIRIEARGDVNQYGEIDKTTLKNDIDVVAAYGELVFKGGKEESPTEEILKDGNPIADAYYGGTVSDGSTTYYTINIKFSDYGYDELKTLMEDGSCYLRIDVGEKSLTGEKGIQISSSTFSKDYQLTTTAGESMARQFALQIKTGGLAYKYSVSDGVDVSSPYGENTDLKCIVALSSLMVALIVFMFVYNKKFGVVFCLSALAFIDLYLFMLIAVPGIKISLGGIIGFALAEILLADGFYVTSARIKEEFAHGKTVKSAIRTGFARALSPVLTSAGIAAAFALLLYAFASGAVKNFGLVFAIGAVVAVFSSVLITRMFTNIILPLVKDKEKFLSVPVKDDQPSESEKEGE